MEINKLNSNVVDRGVLETQDNSATSQAMMQGGRRIQQLEAIIPAFQQMAITTGASQQTIITHTVTAEHACCATTETANAGKPASPEITIRPEYSTRISGFTRAVDRTYHALLGYMQETWDNNSDALSFCLSVATEIQVFSHRKEVDIDHGDYLDFLKNKIGPLYAQSLNPALQVLQNQAIAGRSWEHYEEMFLLARCLEFYSTNENEAADKAMLAQVYQQFVDSELHYLDRMKDSVLQYPCDRSFHIIDTLLSDDSPACRLKILEDDCIAKSREKVAKLRKHRSSLSAMQEGGADRIQKEIKKLKEEIYNGTNDMMIKRTYHEVLVQRIERVEQEWQKAPGQVSDKQLVDFITELADCCKEQSLFLMEFTRLHKNLKSLFCRIGSYILIIIKDRPGNVDYLKNKSMRVMNHLNKTDWLNNECWNLYIHCTKPQAAARTDKITDLQCQQQLWEIMSFMDRKSREDYLTAASMLQRFMDEHENELDTLHTAHSLHALIITLKKRLHSELFVELIIEWDKYNSNNLPSQVINGRMSCHRSTVTQLAPYAPMLMKKSSIPLWSELVCSAWQNTINNLSYQESFEESDVNTLLELRDIMPQISNSSLRSLLILSLARFFLFVLANKGASIPVDKISKLSEWSDDLNQYYSSPHTHILRTHARTRLLYLKEVNDQWKKKQGGITSEGAMAPPNTPGKITPVFVHSGFHATKRSTHVPDGLSGTKRQIMSSEMMQPLTAYGYMPAPADSWSCQQPATIIHASPAQVPIAAGPYPTPIRQFQPAPYGMPTPADSWSCQQPATIIHASPAQAPMAAGPYPTPIRQFQPAPYGMPAPADSWSCQQPATVTHASPANQTPMAAGPYPTPIRQFQPAPYGMPAPADSWSCQQPATVIHASPATQAPMAAGPYPTPIRQFQPAPYGTLTGSQLPMPAMMSHFPAHPHVQVCPSCQFTACEPVQSQEQMATQQQYSVQPATSEHGPKYSGNF